VLISRAKDGGRDGQQSLSFLTTRAGARVYASQGSSLVIAREQELASTLYPLSGLKVDFAIASEESGAWVTISVDNSSQ